MSNALVLTRLREAAQKRGFDLDAIGGIEQNVEAGMLAPRSIADLLKTKAPANDNSQKPRFEVTWFKDIDESKTKRFIIDDAFGEGEFSVVVGKPGSGKSVIITDAACHVAAGRDWHGRAVQKGLVVYFAAERKELTERRLVAFRKHHGIQDIPLAVVGGRLDMAGGLNDARALVAAVLELEAACEHQCVWIIIDTLSRTFGGGDQNASKDMGKYVQAVDELLRGTKAAVTAIHHTTWNESRGKGAIDLDGAVDASFFVSKTGNTFQLKCDGANDGVDGPIVTFTLEAVTLTTDDNGKATTAPVVVSTNANLAGLISENEESPKMSKQRQLALAALQTAISDSGETPPGGTDGMPDGVRVIRRDDWQAAFAKAKGQAGETVNRVFRRHLSDLVALGSVHTLGQWVWPADIRT